MSDESINRWIERPIKKLSPEQLEELLATTISNATNEEYEIEIQALDYNPSNSTSLNDTTEIKIRITKKWESPFDTEEENI